MSGKKGNKVDCRRFSRCFVLFYLKKERKTFFLTFCVLDHGTDSFQNEPVVWHHRGRKLTRVVLILLKLLRLPYSHYICYTTTYCYYEGRFVNIGFRRTAKTFDAILKLVCIQQLKAAWCPDSFRAAITTNSCSFIVALLCYKHLEV